jgi:GNAT superfamily N-acetyltransferase
MTTEPPHAPPGTHLTLETEPAVEDIQFLENSLYEFNAETAGISDGSLLGLFVRDAGGSALGGAFGWSWGGTCHIRYLFLPAEMRRQGHGRRLMCAVELEARRRGCQQIVVETHSFQARGFYEKLGFEVLSHIADYPRGHQYLTLIKHLA